MTFKPKLGRKSQKENLIIYFSTREMTMEYNNVIAIGTITHRQVRDGERLDST